MLPRNSWVICLGRESVEGTERDTDEDQVALFVIIFQGLNSDVLVSGYLEESQYSAICGKYPDGDL